ncbi:helix-turn-helix domain-containing protein [Actinoplanes sp. NPDC049596]|uniref:PucR family transcriptional regulator n=1 Tax=unclassified Actinoplanes TaxID=2626549 RepID=UPI00343FEC1B
MTQPPSPESELVGAVYQKLADDAELIGRRVTAQIRTEFPLYAIVDGPGQAHLVADQLRSLTRGLLERRTPRAAEADIAREVGRMRATQGIPVETVIGAYHIGYRILWDEIRERAEACDPAGARPLLAMVDLLWAWLRATTSAAADGYATAARAYEHSRTALAQTLFNGLYGGDVTGEAVESAARALGFDPRGPFQAVCRPARESEPEPVVVTSVRPGQRPASLVTTRRGAVSVTLVQNAPAESCLRATDPLASVGLTRHGLAGAAESIADAERAFVLAERQRSVVFFADQWLAATLLPLRGRLAPLLQLEEVPSDHIVDTVRAYLAHGLSVPACARALHVHTNTVKYRLHRWNEITGWDVHTADGLIRSKVWLAIG